MLKMDQKDTDMNEKGVTSSTSGVVVQVREKKGPLRAAIPYMPFPVAVICLFLNTFVPGLGTFVSAFTVLCGARTDLPDRHMCCVFWLNIAAAFIQILTAIVMVGWIMSIFWGMDMVILAKPWEAHITHSLPGYDLTSWAIREGEVHGSSLQRQLDCGEVGRRSVTEVGGSGSQTHRWRHTRTHAHTERLTHTHSPGCSGFL
uniref:Stum, mechanosensory transduction mediator homolog n=1 Tax=Oncorhynchus mykiss TaxID=8022 RepID=A0A8C7RED6_ONCMY